MTVKALKMYTSIIPSNIANIGDTVNDIIYYLQTNIKQIDESELFEFKVILNELIINAIKHGNKEQCNKYVKIAAGITKDNSTFFIIEDEGEGYDCKCFDSKSSDITDFFSLCDAKETGRGILIVSNLCDRLRFNFRGNKVVVYKKICKT